MKRVRNSAKAIIIRKGCLLVIQNMDEYGVYYTLPGGGQHYYELLPDAVRREVKEETSLEVKVDNILFIREYLSENHEFAKVEPKSHQVEFMFLCHVDDDSQAGLGIAPDGNQIDIRWLPIQELMSHRLYPLAIRSYIMKISEKSRSLYLGDIN